MVRVLEARSLLRQVTEAAPAAQVTVVRVEGHLVDNENRPATVVAEEVLHRVGWLHRTGGQ